MRSSDPLAKGAHFLMGWGGYGYADFDYLRYDYKSIAPTIY